MRSALLLLVLTISLLAAGLVTSAPLGQEPLSAPSILQCFFFPNPRVDEFVACGPPFSSQPASLNHTVRFAVNVSDPDGDDMNVTFSFDHLRLNATTNITEVNPDSPKVTVTAESPGPGQGVLVQVEWTYRVRSNFTNYRYFVNVDVRDVNATPSSVTKLFSLVVWENSEPSVNGLSSFYSVETPITHDQAGWRIPPLVLEVAVGDPEGDPLVVTWDWGDGTYTLNATPGSFSPVPVAASHVYGVSVFPINETNRNVNLTINLSLDDGVGHNATSAAIAEFYLWPDSWPQVRVTSPALGSRWKVGEPVPIEGSATDLEGDPIVLYFIDVDSQVDVDGDGNPTNDRDVLGNKTTYVYLEPGDHTVTLWATDGLDKKFCLDSSDCDPSLSHWANQTIPFTIGLNQRPSVALATQSAFADEPQVFRVAVFDPDGDRLTVTWDFGDGTDPETNVTISTRDAPRTLEVFRSHVYEHVGPYNLTVEVTDGNETVNATAPVIVESFNEPPVIVKVDVLRANGTAARNNTFALNETVLLNITVYDLEHDDLEIRVDWADGNTTVLQVNVTAGPTCESELVGSIELTKCSFQASHAYVNVGPAELPRFSVVVTVTDHNEFLQWNYTAREPLVIRSHVATQTWSVWVSNPRPVVPDVWDWWDYSTLALALGLPSFLVTRWAVHVRRERREE